MFRFLSEFQDINMNERTLRKRLRIWGLRRRNLIRSNALEQELRYPSFFKAVHILRYLIKQPGPEMRASIYNHMNKNQV